MSTTEIQIAKQDNLVAIYEGQRITQKSGMISLTGIWRAGGEPADRRPVDWLRSARAQEFISHLMAGAPNVEISHVWSSKRGNGGATWGHPQLALMYAQDLSPKLRQFVQTAFFEAMREARDPGLKAARAVDLWRRQGKSDSWVDRRIQGIAARKEFTDLIASRKDNDRAFSMITDAINEGSLGQTAGQLRESRGLGRTGRVRDALSEVELTLVKAAETLAHEKIKADGVYGNTQMASTSFRAGQALKECCDRFLAS